MTNITLKADSIETTSTFAEVRGNVKIQPREVDTDASGVAIDLVAERVVNLTLTWLRTQDQSKRLAALNVVIEASPNGIGEWVEVARFGQVNYDQTGVGSETLGFVSPHQFLRASWHIAARGAPDKLEARFGVSGTVR